MRTLISRLVIAGALLVPAHAFALNGLYIQLGLGYGKFGGSELIMEEQPSGADLPLEGEGCCAKGGLGLDLRLGYSFFGIAGEVGAIGNVWNLGGDTGGGGFYGGGIRAYPLDIFKLVGAELDLPIDLSLGFLIGGAIAGKEFAYTGIGMVVDVEASFELTSFMNIGVKLDVGLPTFGDFAYTDYKNNVGRCLDDSGQQITTGDNFGRVSKENASCNGKGPSSTYLAPQVVATMHFDLIE
jgi:hypothetical protein